MRALDAGEIVVKTVILAGGFGTRLAEYTDVIPKPMVPVGDKPILWHIMNRYAQFGHKDFVLALGYKAHVIRDYFVNFSRLNSDVTVDMATGAFATLSRSPIDWNVTMIDTGGETMTGGRVKRLAEHIGDAPFMLTYGDGLADIDVDALLAFHKSHGKMLTMTAVRPVARFGELVLTDGAVQAFEEKPQLTKGWINGGFMVVEPAFLDLIDGDENMLEREPMDRAVAMGEVMAYQHDGFWQCMDTKRDLDVLNGLIEDGAAPWLRTTT